MIAAVAYTRVSSAEQLREGFSIPAQQKLLREYADKNGILIRKEFSDDESAKGTKREGFAAMVDFIRAGGAAAILVEKTDRLYRNIRDYMTLDELDVEIHFVKEGGRDRRDSDSRFMHGIRVLMARKYVENLSEEVKKGMREKAAEGGWPTWAPLGYLNVKDGSGRSTIVPDAKKAPLVVEIFEAAARGCSLAELVRLADRIGLRGRRGQRITKPTMAYVLRNTAYVGVFEWSGKIYRGKYEPLMTTELFERAQRGLDGMAKPKLRKHSFVYAGIAKCGDCGGALTGDVKKGRYVYYACRGLRGCRRYYAERIFDDAIGGALRSLVVEEAVSTWISASLARWYDSTKKTDTSRAVRIEARLTELRNLGESSYEEKLLGRVSEETWRAVTEKWRREEADLRAELATIRPSVGREEFLQAVRAPFELAQTAADQYLVQPPVEKGRLLKTCCSNLIVTAGSVVITMRSPFDVLMKIAGSPDWLANVDDYRTAVLGILNAA